MVRPKAPTALNSASAAPSHLAAASTVLGSRAPRPTPRDFPPRRVAPQRGTDQTSEKRLAASAGLPIRSATRCGPRWSRASYPVAEASARESSDACLTGDDARSKSWVCTFAMPRFKANMRGTTVIRRREPRSGVHSERVPPRVRLSGGGVHRDHPYRGSGQRERRRWHSSRANSRRARC